MPVVDTRPPVTARPCSCVAASNSPHVAPPLGARDALIGIDLDALHAAQVDVTCRRRTPPRR